MKEINCIAIDDEPIALQIIENFCNRKGDISLRCFNNPLEGLKAIRESKPQLVFLDISMPEMNGLDLARNLPPATCVIFTTAYTEYAFEGFDLDAVDYLHKPFLYERFEKSVEKARRRLNSGENTRKPQTIVVKKEYDSVPIQIDDILYIEAMENYVKIHLADGEIIVSRINMKGIISMLPDDEFIRIHRSYIIPRSKIKNFSKKKVTLSSGEELPVGRLYGDSLQI